MVSAKSFCANNRYYQALAYKLINQPFISIGFYPKSNNKFNLTTREYFKNS